MKKNPHSVFNKNFNKLALAILVTLFVAVVSPKTYFLYTDITSPTPPPPLPKPEINYTELKIPVLMYHHIRPYSADLSPMAISLSVDPEKFATQLDYIQNLGYTTTNFKKLASNDLPTKPIILTFDDGYEDFYTNALPELKKHHMTAVTYIITKQIDTDTYMSLRQILELQDYGIEIGSHTLHHYDLSTLSDKDQQAEIIESKKILENLLEQPVVSFCYPYGKYNKTSKDLVEKAGYKFALTVNGGISNFSHLLDLERLRVNYDTNIQRYFERPATK